MSWRNPRWDLVFVDPWWWGLRLRSMKLRRSTGFIPYSQAHRGRTQDKGLFEVVVSHHSEQNTSYWERCVWGVIVISCLFSPRKLNHSRLGVASKDEPNLSTSCQVEGCIKRQPVPYASMCTPTGSPRRTAGYHLILQWEWSISWGLSIYLCINNPPPQTLETASGAGDVASLLNCLAGIYKVMNLSSSPT